MLIEKANLKSLYCVRLNPGDDLLLSLREAVEKQGIKNALVISGLGSVTSHHYHVVASSINPPKEDFTKGEKPA